MSNPNYLDAIAFNVQDQEYVLILTQQAEGGLKYADNFSLRCYGFRDGVLLNSEETELEYVDMKRDGGTWLLSFKTGEHVIMTQTLMRPFNARDYINLGVDENEQPIDVFAKKLNFEDLPSFVFDQIKLVFEPLSPTLQHGKRPATNAPSAPPPAPL